MDFILYVASVASCFGALLATGAAVVWWQGRHRRAHEAYWNGRT